MTGKTDNLHPMLCEYLEAIEVLLKRELHVTSGQRKVSGKLLAGGTQSEHEYDPAEGVDIRVKNGYERCQVVETALEVCNRMKLPKRIGVYDKHVHLGIGKDKPQPVMWSGVSK